MKQKTPSIFFALALLALLCNVNAAPIDFTGSIKSDATLNVPSDFSDIQSALSYLADKRINDGVTVTIQVADGTYNNYSTINVTHPDGNNIRILGNTSSPASCVINFASGNNGVFVANADLGNMNGFTLAGVDDAGTAGIYITNGATAILGNAMVVRDFQFGVSVMSSRLHISSAGGFLSTSNTYGFLVNHNGHLVAQNTLATYNVIGYESDLNSVIYAYAAGAQNNSSIGFQARMGSYIHALSTSGNTYSNGVNYSPSNAVGNQNSYVEWN